MKKLIIFLAVFAVLSIMAATATAYRFNNKSGFTTTDGAGEKVNLSLVGFGPFKLTRGNTEIIFTQDKAMAMVEIFFSTNKKQPRIVNVKLFQNNAVVKVDRKPSYSLDFPM